VESTVFIETVTVTWL